jgi:lipid II:glycine glycyltransferase (peptidoglycan interpeptide bridge formation enzyme)
MPPENGMLLTAAATQEWNAFVAQAPQGDFLQAWEWGDLKARTGWRPLRFAVREGGRIAAGAQVLTRPVPGGRKLFYASRGPLALEDQAGALLPQLLEEIREVARRERALALKVDPAVAGADQEYAALLRSLGFRRAPRDEGAFGGLQPRYVMKVDLAPAEEALLASFHPKWRYNVRLAERKGVAISADTTRADVPAFYEVLQETAARDGFGVRAQSYFLDMWDTCVTAGLAHLFLGRLDGEVICGAICFALGRQAWYVYGASANQHRNVMPNHLLQWEMMRWAKARGCTVYDMRGVAREAGPEDQESRLHGLNRFKRGFGARYVEYLGEFDLVFSPLWYGLLNVAEPAARSWRAWRRGRKAAATD